MLKKTLIACCTAALVSGVSATAQASEAELLQKLEKLSAELETIKAQLAATQKQTAAVEQKVQAKEAEKAVSTEKGIAVGADTVVSSYGEVNYSRPRNSTSDTQVDVARAVIGITHRFDEKTKMVSEFEWEHAVTSKDDQGEAEVEQLYVEHEFSNAVRAKAGLFLMPIGFINTNHEPLAYYGVHRNFVETAIIPSTWREAGLGLSGNFDNGLSWDAGLTTGFNLSKWDPTSSDGTGSPLRAIHQEGQLAAAHDLSVHGALNWRGLPGLVVGGSVFAGKVGQAKAGFAANDARLVLWDLHSRYTPGNWDLSALYSRGTFNNIDNLNAGFAAAGNPTLVPSSFYGWYLQGANKVWQSGEYSLSPFVRYEQWNTGASYTASANTVAAAENKAWTVGASFKIGEGVVLKADYQKFKQDSNRDSLNLGVGYSF